MADSSGLNLVLCILIFYTLVDFSTILIQTEVGCGLITGSILQPVGHHTLLHHIDSEVFLLNEP